MQIRINNNALKSGLLAAPLAIGMLNCAGATAVSYTHLTLPTTPYV